MDSYNFISESFQVEPQNHKLTKTTELVICLALKQKYTFSKYEKINSSKRIINNKKTIIFLQCNTIKYFRIVGAR